MAEEVRWAVEKNRVAMTEEYRGEGRTTHNFCIAHASLLVFLIFIIIYFGGN